ncbi:hypothetical protein Bca52824_094271 [Brassica carinata]|uniref:Uncharacterized protein n=1 Tax=Brassica carinata TaxID=52824 RepID=A0A8X7P2I0_BRACI|nr:hypothetical protein Bca52824_094271 [Brassica carinata]
MPKQDFSDSGFHLRCHLHCTIFTLKIVFPSNVLKRPFCGDVKLQPLNMYGNSVSRCFYLTDQETVDFYWMVVFLPSMMIFLVSSVYLVAGIFVAYSAPHRHCGVRCLSILNVVFAIIYGLLAIFLGSSLLALGSSCSVPLFWCSRYLHGVWRRADALTIDEGEFGNRNHQGLEMLEANPLEFTPDVERRVNQGFKAWMGNLFPNVTAHTLSSRQRS